AIDAFIRADPRPFGTPIHHSFILEKQHVWNSKNRHSNCLSDNNLWKIFLSEIERKKRQEISARNSLTHLMMRRAASSISRSFMRELKLKRIALRSTSSGVPIA